MTDKQQSDALRLADELEDSLESHDGSSLTARCQGIADAAAAELLRLHAENETLRTGYEAARLEIESLKAQLHAAKQINTAQFWLLTSSIPGSALRASHWQAPAQAAPAYKDSTPELHIGDSAFESWYSTYSPAHKSDKQRARDAYAAGMGDPMVTAAPENIRGILARCRDFIDTTKAPAYPAGADLADEIDVLLAAQPAPAAVTGPSGYGPKVTVKRRCSDCKACNSESYAVQGDSGHYVYCEHPSLPESKYIGDTNWNTPHWCPVSAPTTQPAPQREPAEIDTATMVLAESVGLIGPASRTHDLHGAIQRFHDLICANATIKAAEAISAAAPQPSPAAQGDALDAAVSTRWLTVVYRDVAAGDEAREIFKHPKASAMSWSHAMHERDAARAAQEDNSHDN